MGTEYVLIISFLNIALDVKNIVFMKACFCNHSSICGRIFEDFLFCWVDYLFTFTVNFLTFAQSA